MDGLRWILLGVAVVIVGAVFFLSRNKRKEKTTLMRDAADEIPSFSANDRLEGEHNENSHSNSWLDGVGPVRVVSEVEQQSFFDENDDWSDAQTNEAEVADTEFKSEIEHHSEVSSAKLPSEDLPEEKLPEEKQPEEQQPEAANAQESLAEQSEVVVASHPQEKTSPETKETTTDLETPDSVEDESDADKDAQAEDDVIAVYVLASKEEPVIKGDKILSASYALDLQHGDMKIFHRIEEVSVGGVVKDEIQFSMANLHEPGWFEIEDMNQLETSGLSFFMQVNLVKNPAAVLDEMLICAHKMSAMLGAKLCSAQRQLLDEAYTIHLRNKVKRLVKTPQSL